MPIDISALRAAIQQLADGAVRNEDRRTEQAAHLRRVFAAGFDGAAWMHQCEAASKVDGWTGAHFNGAELATATFNFDTQLEPQRYALISADGSQVLPDRHKEVQYYFVQAGAACIVYGVPEEQRDAALRDAMAFGQTQKQELVYDTARLQGKDNRIISPGEVSNKRDVLEIELLSECCERFAAAGVRAIAVADGSLVPFALLNENFIKNSRKEARELCDRMVMALNKMRKAKASVAGYIDRPDSNAFVKACWLSTLGTSPINKQNLQTVDDVATGLFDRHLLEPILAPQQRTAFFDPNWLVNDANWLGRGNHAMRACYINFGVARHSNIVRLEMPQWCLADGAAEELCAVLQRQTWVGNGWPFVLKAAHEQSVVTKADQAELEYIIRDELDRRGLRAELSAKQFSKNRR
jgi:hypothetical protein